MTASYGIAPKDSTEPELSLARPDHDAEETDALLGRDVVAKPILRDGHATLHSSIGNLANTIIGSGAYASSFLRTA